MTRQGFADQMLQCFTAGKWLCVNMLAIVTKPHFECSSEIRSVLCNYLLGIDHLYTRGVEHLLPYHHVIP